MVNVRTVLQGPSWLQPPGHVVGPDAPVVDAGGQRRAGCETGGGAVLSDDGAAEVGVVVDFDVILVGVGHSAPGERGCRVGQGRAVGRGGQGRRGGRGATGGHVDAQVIEHYAGVGYGAVRYQRDADPDRRIAQAGSQIECADVVTVARPAAGPGAADVGADEVGAVGGVSDEKSVEGTALGGFDGGLEVIGHDGGSGRAQVKRAVQSPGIDVVGVAAHAGPIAVSAAAGGVACPTASVGQAVAVVPQILAAVGVAEVTDGP
jgi:hypothetical protein